jgi:hypothetical protein
MCTIYAARRQMTGTPSLRQSGRQPWNREGYLDHVPVRGLPVPKIGAQV